MKSEEKNSVFHYNYGEMLLKMHQDLRDSEQMKALSKIDTFKMSIKIFNGNYEELVRSIEEHNEPSVYMKLRQEGKHILHEYQGQIARLLHNYVASAQSLIDHTRLHHRELYGKNNVFPDYQEQIVAKFSKNSLAVFVKDLRQYFQHYKIPNFSSTLSFKKEATDFEVKLLLSVVELKEFSGWKALSSQFLLEQDKDIDLLYIVKNYYTLVEEFYTWFDKRQKEIHDADYDFVEEQKFYISIIAVNDVLLSLISRPWNISDLVSDASRLIKIDTNDPVFVAATEIQKLNIIIKEFNEYTNIDETVEKAVIESFEFYNLGEGVNSSAFD